MLFTLIIALFILILFDVVAVRWGADSRDTINSPEWKRHEKFWI